MHDRTPGTPFAGDASFPHNDANDMRRRRRSPWNPATWTPITTSFAANPRYRAPGTPGGRGFAATEHLAPEAVAAYVDGELTVNAHLRAAGHLEVCAECRAAVDAQSAARTMLRSSSGPLSVPPSLLGQLAAIPTQEIDMTNRGPLHPRRGR
ncbi:hypothetical protein GOEFS_017_00740 [Gordonia effusa NBRC 100432]|uniref:Putative zinc-finger domain-containing protein n=1 Tax=Gordonia effusa NBRC 100432 TaxID=1077974 RepID=H0QVV7_9ACTN|nr:hypothetical protein GOEFS_017_00740 [Gordonia effusa NBRC 100432]